MNIKGMDYLQFAFLDCGVPGKLTINSPGKLAASVWKAVPLIAFNLPFGALIRPELWTRIVLPSAASRSEIKARFYIVLERCSCKLSNGIFGGIIA